MNAKNLIAAVSLFAAAGSVLADQTYPYVEHTNIASTKTRAEVIAEMKPAVTEFSAHRNAAGSGAEAAYQPVGGSEFVEHLHVASTRTREEVRNEAMQAARGTQVNVETSGN